MIQMPLALIIYGRTTQILLLVPIADTAHIAEDQISHNHIMSRGTRSHIPGLERLLIGARQAPLLPLRRSNEKDG